jgi:hypothetical protein
MRGLIEFLFGVDLEGWSEGDRWSIEWLSAGEGGDFWFWALALLAGIGALIAALYRRDTSGQGHEVRTGVRRTMTALRVAVIALLGAMLLEPALLVERTEHVPSNLIVLLDASQSMDLSDPFPAGPPAEELARLLDLAGPADLERATRGELAQALLGRGGLRARLEAGGDRRVRIHPFADRLVLEELAPGAAPSGSLSEAARAYTALGTAVEQALAAYQGTPLAGILVISDGQSNAGGEVDPAAKAARAAGVPVHVLAVGAAAQARNVAITRLEVDPVALVRDPFAALVHVEARGLDGETLQVVLERRRADGGTWELVEQRALEVTEAGRLAQVPFRLKEEEPGNLELRARVLEVGRETSTDDNLALGSVRVVKQQMRVLLVAGLAFPEVQFLINTLMRDPAYDLSAWLQGAEVDYEQKGNTVLRALPRTSEELDAYDVVVLYDPDLNKLPVGLVSMLPDFVGREAGGLVYIAGEGATGELFDRKHPESEALLELLPVVREPGVFRSRTEKRMIAAEPWRMVLTEAGRDHELFRFADDPVENQRIQASLPGMFWHFPVTRAKPGATVLARHGDPRMQNRYGPHVVVASHWYGPGRVTFLALDSTYRWRYLEEAYFDGFWARLVGEAGRAKLLGGRTPLTVTSDQTSYAPGSVVTLSARFRDPPAPGAAPPSLLGLVEVGDAQPREVFLLPREDDPTTFEAHYRPTQGGRHVVRVWPSAAPPEGVDASGHRFEVELPDRELASPWLDRATLASLAGPSGGEVFPMVDQRAIPAAFTTRRVALVSQDRQAMWDAPFFYGLAFLFLFLEWVLRKRYRLV